MYTNLFSGFTQSVRGMQTAQHAVAAHGTNIANANDPQYTRRLTIPESQDQLGGPGLLRLRDAFVEERFRQAAGASGDAQMRQDLMRKVEDILGDPVTGGMRQAIDRFFDAWKGLSENPADGVARLQVLASGGEFAQQIGLMHTKLTALEQTANEQLATRVSEVNTQIEKVADLNVRIAGLKRNRMQFADLADQRDAAIDQLAKLTGVTAMEQPDGTARLFAGPTPIVDGPSITRLTLVEGMGAPQPSWDAYQTPTYGSGGLIGGLVDIRDNEIAQLKGDIDALGQAVALQVNELHRAGSGLNGETGLDFFVIGPGPANIAVNRDLAAEQIAAGAGSGEPGDGENARLLAQMADEPILASVIIPGQIQSARTFYRNMVGWVGSRTQDAMQRHDISTAHLRVSEQQRQSDWGVSLDEEVAQLQMQQKAFAASARVLSVIDDMLDHLINRTGR